MYEKYGFARRGPAQALLQPITTRRGADDDRRRSRRQAIARCSTSGARSIARGTPTCGRERRAAGRAWQALLLFAVAFALAIVSCERGRAGDASAAKTAALTR